MVAANPVQTDTLADVKDEAKPFNLKLRRVLNDKSAKDLANLLKVKTQTVYQWKSRGFQLAPYQVPIVAKFAGCSLDYLCDDSIPVDADPTQGSGPTLSDEQLAAELRERYLKAATGMDHYLQELQGTRWAVVGRELLYQKPGDTPSPELQRAQQLIDRRFVMLDVTIKPFQHVFKDDSIDPALRYDSLSRRMVGVFHAPCVCLVDDARMALRDIDKAKRQGRDANEPYQHLEQLRDEMDRLEASGEHLLQTCAGVVESGGVGSYLNGIWKLGEQQFERILDQGEEAIETVIRAWGETGSSPFSDEVQKQITADMTRQSEYDAYAAYMVAVVNHQPRPSLEDDAFQLRILDRGKQRIEALMSAFARHFAQQTKGK